jgi:bifunctional DNA-binding transcriptional regulator/antitoxin component of YhaV-PrlF toxin-antitoxin module
MGVTVPPVRPLRKIDSQNRVALPDYAMEALQVKAGEQVAFDVDGQGRVIVFKADVVPAKPDRKRN